jgi:DNA-binding MarR family transcriptional regulator
LLPVNKETDMEETDSHSTEEVARRFFEVVPPLWHSMSYSIRYSGEERTQVTFPQMRAMAILRHQPASLNDLANAHEVSAATMSRMISTLVERGWVQRREEPQDRRQVRLTLTEAGQASLDAFGKRSLDYLAEILSELSATELTELERSLGALARIVATRMPNHRLPDDPLANKP